MNAGKSCEDRLALLQVALTPFVFLRQYWESIAPHERSEWYSTEDLAGVEEEVSKVLGEVSMGTLDRDSHQCPD
jgi:hypothetical protein